MSFLRHGEFHRSDVEGEPAAATLGRRCRAQGSDESPAGFPWRVAFRKARLRFAGYVHSGRSTPVRQKVSSERQPVPILLVSGEGFSVLFTSSSQIRTYSASRIPSRLHRTRSRQMSFARIPLFCCRERQSSFQVHCLQNRRSVGRLPCLSGLSQMRGY